MAAVALGLLTAVTLLGTSIVPLSRLVVGRPIVVGAAFYNNVLTPIGLLLLAAVAATPLLRWGGPPGGLQRKMLLVAAGGGTIAAGVAWLCGQRHPLNLAVLAAAAAALIAAAESFFFDAIAPAAGPDDAAARASPSLATPQIRRHADPPRLRSASPSESPAPRWEPAPATLFSVRAKRSAGKIFPSAVSG